MTARIMVRSCWRNCSMRPLTCPITARFWPSVVVRTMPGRSIRVRSGAPGASTLMTIESDENECACECVSTSVSVSMRFVSSDGDETMPDAEGWGPDQETETCAFQGVPGAVHFMSSWVGHLVTKPAPRGNGMPETASSTDDFPDDWSPITAICGKGRSWCTPCDLSSSTKSSHGRTASREELSRLLFSAILEGRSTGSR
mmetsp:Transcript_94089/g.269385  ORF Transcript_94089/g.269385 Transcript_94089/m.269385 type:complete len:200 (-) Transcript_94089:39-638(-)